MDYYLFFMLIFIYAFVTIGTIGVASDFVKYAGKSSYPIQRELPTGKLNTFLHFVPLALYLRYLKLFPEVNKPLLTRIETYQKLFRTTGDLFVRPKPNIGLFEEAKFYFSQLSDPSNFLLTPKSLEGFTEFRISEEKNIVSFKSYKKIYLKVLYRLPAPSLKCKEETRYDLVWSLTYDDYKRLVLAEGLQKMLSLETKLEDAWEVIQYQDEQSVVGNLTVFHRDIFKNLYDVFEESLVSQGEISEATYEKAYQLLESFADEVLTSAKSRVGVPLYSHQEIEDKLQRKLEAELTFQCDVLSKKEPTKNLS